MLATGKCCPPPDAVQPPVVRLTVTTGQCRCTSLLTSSCGPVRRQRDPPYGASASRCRRSLERSPGSDLDDRETRDCCSVEN
jgi:hypothetical protein